MGEFLGFSKSAPEFFHAANMRTCLLVLFHSYRCYASSTLTRNSSSHFLLQSSLDPSEVIHQACLFSFHLSEMV